MRDNKQKPSLVTEHRNIRASLRPTKEETNRDNDRTIQSDAKDRIKEQKQNVAGNDPEFAAACPICLEEELSKKYLGFELYDHLNGKCHTKSNLAGFLSQEATYVRFWESD